MDVQLLKIVGEWGKWAGIGGLALGTFLFLVRDVIRLKIFPQLTKAHAYKVIRLILLLVWSVAVAGLSAWVWVETQRNRSARDPNASALQREIFLDKAWGLLGGEEGLPRLYAPTNDRAKLELARDEIEKALIIDPESTKALRYKSIYLNAIGRQDEATKLLQQLVEREPNNPDLLNDLAGMLRVQGNLFQAAKMAEKAIQLEPNDPALYSNLGMTRRLQGRFEDAEIALRRAIALDSTDGRVHLYLGDILAQTGRIEGARSEIQAALRLEPKLAKKLSPESATLLGIANTSSAAE